MSFPSNFLISLYILTPFQCFCSNNLQYSSLSQKAIVLNPTFSKAKLNPPIPLNRSKWFICFLVHILNNLLQLDNDTYSRCSVNVNYLLLVLLLYTKLSFHLI